MTLIHVPRPKNAWNAGRPVNALLKVQMEHLSAAERKLPTRFRSEIYVNAIKTEGEAAEYIRTVTEAIQAAHDEASANRAQPGAKRAKPGAKRAKPAAKKRRVIEIAAVADERAERRQAKKTQPKKAKAKKRSGKSGRKK
jgi:hypothetical protein